MSINLSTKKIVMVLILILIAGGSFWWFVSTKDIRKEISNYKALIRFANRQEVEIAVIKQSSILQQLKAQIRKANLEAQAKVQKQLKDAK
ncbi:MAG: hypothetical protein ACUZ9M_00590 [Candidatus Scalindua sp.]